MQSLDSVLQQRKRIFSADILLLDIRPPGQRSIWRQLRRRKFVLVKLGHDCFKPCKWEVGCDSAVDGVMQTFVIKPVVDLRNPKMLRGLLDK